jgi:hypothetical protein
MRAGRLAAASVLVMAALGAVGCALDMTNLPITYLKQAKVAVQHHDAAAATAAINEAENRWLGSNTPYGNPNVPSDPEALREMGRARQAIAMGRWGDAEYYVNTAMTHPSMLTPG